MELQRYGQHAGASYLVAVAATGTALLVRFLLSPLLGHDAPLLIFVLAVAAAAWVGGFWPGLLATVLSVLVGDYWFVPPIGIFTGSADERIRLVLFLLVGVTLSVVNEAKRKARRYSEERRLELEREVEVRRRAEQTVRQKVEELAEVDRRKDQFLATLAHELRNPLAPISNALEVWPSLAGDASELDQLRGIMSRQVRQMNRLVDDLLDVSRMTRGIVQLRKRPVEVTSIIESAVESAKPLIDRLGHRLIVQLPPYAIWLHADDVRLVQVVGNLLNNAAKYSGTSGVVELIVEREVDEAVVRIRDNGPGIPQEMLSDIFKLFVQVHDTLDRSQGGLGIGLTLAQSLIAAHGGTIEARNRSPGTGAEFVMRLTALSTAYRPPDEDLNSHDMESRRELPTLKILVADDVRASAKTVAMMLKAIGQEEVLEVHNGLAAVEEAVKHSPDIILCDIAMPGLDGFEIAQRLRRESACSETLLVALTGFSQEEDRRRAIAAGFDRHLTKPTSLQELQQLLASVSCRKRIAK